jgi:hypothetical protein
MAYISADDVRCIRKALQARFKNTKFSVSKNAHSSAVTVAILSAPDSFTDDQNGVPFTNRDINVYHLGNYKHSEVLEEMLTIIKTASPKNQWYDKSDSQVDYFHTAFYIHLTQGKWKKPFEIKKPKGMK